MWRLGGMLVVGVALAGCRADPIPSVSVRIDLSSPDIQDDTRLVVDGKPTTWAEAIFDTYADAESHPFVVKSLRGGQTVSELAVGVDDGNCLAGCGLAAKDIYHVSVQVCADPAGNLSVGSSVCGAPQEVCNLGDPCPPQQPAAQ